MADRETMSTPHAVDPELDRGAILPPETEAPVNTRSVPLMAATYTSPAHTIVRLVAEPLLVAEDTALATQGFTRTRTAGVGQIRPTAIGFPAWPILVDPGNARQTLNLVGDVEWARRVAHSRPGDVKKRFEKLAAELMASAPHLVPPLFEEIARILHDVGNDALALQFFGRAREIERAHDVPVDPDRHRAVFTEFSSLGIVGAGEMTAEAESAVRRFADPGDAFDYLLELNTARIAVGGRPPYADLARDLRDVGAAAGLDPDRVDELLLGNVIGLAAVRRAPAEFFDSVRDSLIRHIGRHPETASWFLEVRPRELGVDDYLLLLRDSGIWRSVTADPRATGDLLLRLVDELRGGAAGEVPATPHLIEVIDACHDALAGRRSGSRDLRSLSLDLLDALCAAGVVFAPRSFRDPVRADSLDEPWLCWLEGEHEDAGQPRRDLGHLAADPVLGPVAARSLDPGFLTHHADTVLGHPGATALLNMRLTDFAAERAAATGSFEALERFLDGPVKRLRDPRIDESNPGAIERIFAFDRAEELAAALRSGMAVEYTFPALEEAVERVRTLAADTDTRRTVPGGWEFDPLKIHESWPLHAVSCGGFVVVFDGDGIVCELQVPGEVGEFVGVRTVGNRVRVSYKARHAHEESVFWSGDDAGHDTGELVTSVEGSASWEIDAGRITANGLITDGDVTANRWQSPVLVTPSAVVGVRSLVHHACPRFDPRTGESLGEIDLRLWPERLTELGVPVGDLDLGVLPPAVWEFPADPDADRDTVHRMEYATCLPVITGTTADSLTGHCGGWHLNFPVDHGPFHHIIGPLGTFRIPRDRRLSPTTAIARPGGGVVVNCADGFIDADTGRRLPLSLEGDGRHSYLDHLPDTCLHFLSARDETLSTRLRTVTAGDVAPLLDDGLTPGHRRELIAERLGTRDAVVIDAIDGLVRRSAEVARKMNEIHPPVDKQVRVPDISEDLDAYIHGYLGTGGGGLNNYGALLTKLGLAIRRSELHSYGYEEWDRINWGIGFIGNERALAALVAAPCLSPELRREAVGFVRSLLKAGLVCNGWRYVEVPADAVESTGTLYEGWHDDCVVISYRYDHDCTGSTGRGDRIVLLAPEDKRHWMGVDLGDSVDTSLSAPALTAVLDAVDAREPQAAERLEELRAGVDTIARATGVPARVLLRLLVAPLPSTHRETKEERALLGLTVQQSKTAREIIDQFEPEECAAILAAAVDPDDPTAFTAGNPDTDAVVAAIGRVLGEPAVRLTDADLDLLVGRQTDPEERNIRRLLRGGEVVDDTGVRDSYLGLLITIAVECSITVDEAAWIARQMRAAADWVRRCPDTRRREWDQLVPVPGPDNSWELVDDQPVPVLARIIAAGGMDDLISWLESGGFPPDPRRWDPVVAVPHLVQEVAETKGLGTDAARYWLELLALTAPDDRLIRELNGWTGKDLDAAATELLQRGLVIEAKRKGANRARFLPGGWLEASGPDRPMEVWKAPHHLLWEDDCVHGMIPGCPQVVPPAELYLDVWERIRGGDEPGYTELRTGAYLRKRR